MVDANILFRLGTPANVQTAQAAANELAQMPIRNQLLEAQAKGTDLQNQKIARAIKEEDAAFVLRDVALDAMDVMPIIKRGNMAEFSAFMDGRIRKIEGRGGDATESRAFKEQMESGLISPDVALERLQGAVEKARQAGVLEGASGRDIRPGFVGSPQRVTDGGQNYLTGLYQDEYGNVTEKRVPVSGQFVSPLGETAEEQTDRAIGEAGGKRIAQLSADLKIKPEIEKKTTQAREFASAEVQKIIAQQGQLSKIADADAIYRSLTPDKLDLIYGYGEKWYPEFLRSQEGIDLQAQRDQLVGMITLASRKELQGQGPITDAEQVALSQAATALSNPNISPRLAKRYIDDAMDMIYGNAGKPFTPPDRLNAPPPPTGGRQQTLDQQVYEVDF